jgi:16S rRNA G527 N7-methylase RsmG
MNAISEMELPNARVRVERLSPGTVEAQFNAVTSRASGPIVDFIEIAACALRNGGTAILYANPSQTIRSRLATISALGLLPDRRFVYEVERYGQAVKRLLATWRKSPDESG